ncbi:hypothetical protein ABSL23_01055 (plasmid) [Halobacterium sp. NMX12-1]|uniref:Amphi-Trp domain-containing protein n=1 Tax=Halobacterium sp. NMX12-1 TaxID=3166650 RepID=A0AAU8C8U4_9EURY
MTNDETPSQQSQPVEQSEVFGPIDAGALREIRDLVMEQEPLAETASLDDPLNPQTLSVELSDGVGAASTARIDIRWSLTENYAIHYTDDRNQNFRFDCHPKPDAPSRLVGESCIAVSEAGLVTRTILQRWRYAYAHETFEGINDAEDPP